MSRQEAERLFIDGGKSKEIREKYNEPESHEEFVSLAAKDGYDFSVDDLKEALRLSGDSFQTYGCPRKRSIWWT